MAPPKSRAPMREHACLRVVLFDPTSAHPLSSGADKLQAQRALLRFEQQRRVQSNTRQALFKNLHEVRLLPRTCLLPPADDTAQGGFVHPCQLSKLVLTQATQLHKQLWRKRMAELLDRPEKRLHSAQRRNELTSLAASTHGGHAAGSLLLGAFLRQLSRSPPLFATGWAPHPAAPRAPRPRTRTGPHR